VGYTTDELDALQLESGDFTQSRVWSEAVAALPAGNNPADFFYWGKKSIPSEGGMQNFPPGNFSRVQLLKLNNIIDQIIQEAEEIGMPTDQAELKERLNLIRKARQISADAEIRLSVPQKPVNEMHAMTDQELVDFINLGDAERIAASKPSKVFQPSGRKPVMAGGDGDMASVMAAMLQPYMGVDEDRVREIAAEVSLQVANGIIAKTLDINVHTPQGMVTIQGAHKQTEEILFWVGQGKHVYLWGPPGGGKTTVARHVATGLKRGFGYMMLNAMTSPSQILGFVGADAKTYKPSAFREHYVQSSIMCFDELDNCNPNTLTTINGPIENGECQFPDGLHPMHSEFKIIATGNTAGRGGNIMHAGRQSLDAATLARFVCIEFKYDLDLEERMVKAVSPKNGQHVLKWVRDVREYVRKNDVKLVVSPREAVNLAIGAEMAPFGNELLVDQALFKGFNPDAVRNILTNLPIPAWTRANPPAPKATVPVKVKTPVVAATA
jgi:MoxR-like ATPase